MACTSTMFRALSVQHMSSDEVLRMLATGLRVDIHKRVEVGIRIRSLFIGSEQGFRSMLVNRLMFSFQRPGYMLSQQA